MKKNDVILIGTLLGIALVLFLAMFLVKQNTVHGEAVVWIQGKEYGRYPLSVDREVEIPGLIGTNVLKIHDGKAWMSTAVCPDKNCVWQGKIDENKETIICRPGSIMVIIENGEEQKLDAIVQ